jgi:phosphomevalonate kinase
MLKSITMRASVALVATAGIAAAVWAIRKRLREQQQQQTSAPEKPTPPRLVVIFSGKRKSGKVRARSRGRGSARLAPTRAPRSKRSAGVRRPSPRQRVGIADARIPANAPHTARLFPRPQDYVTDRLVASLGAHATIGRLSGPLKGAYAKEHGLDFAQLLSDGPYKEKYRADMIVWGERRRHADPGFFARLVVAESRAPVLIISDARRASDMAFFTAQYPYLTVRVRCTDATRARRSWVQTEGVDDVESECGLDGYAHDLSVDNDGDAAALQAVLEQLEATVRRKAALPPRA